MKSDAERFAAKQASKLLKPSSNSKYINHEITEFELLGEVDNFNYDCYNGGTK